MTFNKKDKIWYTWSSININHVVNKSVATFVAAECLDILQNYIKELYIGGGFSVSCRIYKSVAVDDNWSIYNNEKKLFAIKTKPIKVLKILYF